MSSTDKINIDAAISAQKALLLTFPEGSDEHLDTMEHLSDLYLTRSEDPSYHVEDLEQAIDIRREICRFTSSPSHIHRHFNSLYNFSLALQRRYCLESKTNEIISVNSLANIYFRDSNDLDELISTQQAALKLCPPDHPLHLLLLTQLGSALMQRGESLAEDVEAIHMLRSTLSLWPVNDVHRLSVLKNFAFGLQRRIARSERGSANEELAELVNIYREIADHHSPTAASRVESLLEAVDCITKLCFYGCMTPWAEIAHELGAEILRLSPNNRKAQELIAEVEVYEDFAKNGPKKMPYLQPRHEYQLSRVGESSARPSIGSPETDDDPLEMINLKLQQNILHLLSTESVNQQYKSRIKDILHLWKDRFQLTSDPEDIDAAIEYSQMALQNLDEAEDGYRLLISDIGELLSQRYRTTLNIEDHKSYTRLWLEQGPDPSKPIYGPTFIPHPDATSLPPSPEPVKAASDISTDSYDAEDVTSCRKEVARLQDLGQINRILRDTMKNLAYRLFERFTSSHPVDFSDIKEAVGVMDQLEQIFGYQAAQTSIPSRGFMTLCWYRRCNDPNLLDQSIQYASTRWASQIAELVEALYERYVRSGNQLDLVDALKYARKLVKSHPPGDDNSNARVFVPLGLILNTQYLLHGDVADLEETLQYSWTNHELAEAYIQRYERFLHPEDLESAYKEAFAPEEEIFSVMDYAEDLDFLNTYLSFIQVHILLAKYKVEQDDQLLSQAEDIVLGAEAGCPKTMYPNWLHSYAQVLAASGLALKDNSKLSRSLTLQTKALQLLPEQSIYQAEFLASLGQILVQYYDITDQISDLETGIDKLRKALALITSSNPDYIAYTLSLAEALTVYAQKTGESKHMLEAKLFFRDAAFSSIPLQRQYLAAVNWAQAAASVALDNDETLYAYEAALDIHQKLASLELDVRTRHDTLIKSMTSIASHAALWAIRNGRVEQAVEFLEQGLSVFWQQSMQLRNLTTTLAEADSVLASRLAEISLDLRISEFRSRSDEDTEKRLLFLGRDAISRRELAKEWASLVERARAIPGHENLFRTPTYKTLASAASNRIIVMLSATATTCHAIIIKNPESKPISLELPAMSTSRASYLVKSLTLNLNLAGYRDSRREIGDMHGVKRKALRIPDGFRYIDIDGVLKILWHDVVEPVLRLLDLKEGLEPSHLTWCCVGELALLPIHAAGLYNQSDSDPIGLLDFVIPSYTPRLTHLLSAKRSDFTGPVKVLIAGQSTSPQGYAALPNVVSELKRISEVISTAGPDISYVQLNGENATCHSVLTNMVNCHVIHFACHGSASPDPLDSAIILHDGKLQIGALMRTQLENAKIAFLSACQTAQMSPEEPNESIHVASAMLFAGFQSIVGTMWSICDNDAPQIAESFYRSIVKDGTIQFSDVAMALHKAVKDLKSSGVSSLRWASFIHIGV